MNYFSLEIRTKIRKLSGFCILIMFATDWGILLACNILVWFEYELKFVHQIKVMLKAIKQTELADSTYHTGVDDRTEVWGLVNDTSNNVVISQRDH